MQCWMDWLNTNSGAVTALATLAGVLVTGVYAGFTVLLWQATKRQAEITGRIFEATHRPELAVHPYCRFPSHPGAVRLDFKLTNHGSMAATVVAWNATLRQAGVVLGESGVFKGPLCVFPHATEEGVPIEARDESAGLVWKGDPEVRLEVVVSYRGSSPVSTYSTSLRAHLRFTGYDTFTLEQVQHEVH